MILAERITGMHSIPNILSLPYVSVSRFLSQTNVTGAETKCQLTDMLF